MKNMFEEHILQKAVFSCVLSEYLIGVRFELLFTTFKTH